MNTPNEIIRLANTIIDIRSTPPDPLDDAECNECATEAMRLAEDHIERLEQFNERMFSDLFLGHLKVTRG